MTKEIIIHMGSPKTGSSFLQNCILENADVFKQHGILFPGVQHENGGVYVEKSNVPINGQLLTRIFRNPTKEYLQLGPEVESIFLQLVAFDSQRILISDETLGVLHKSIWGLFHEVALRLSINLKVIGYYRNPGSYYPSHWAQIVRMHGESRSLADFTLESNLSVWENLLAMKEVIKEGVIVSYENELPKGLIYSMIDFLGVNECIKQIEGSSLNKKVNQSLSFSALHALRAINAEFGEDIGVAVNKVLSSTNSIETYAKPKLPKELFDLVQKRHFEQVGLCWQLYQQWKS